MGRLDGDWSLSQPTPGEANADPLVGPIVISEILYHPAEDPNAEFVELTNVGAETINLNLVRFTRGIDYTFPAGSLLGPGACLAIGLFGFVEIDDASRLGAGLYARH